MSSGGGKLIAVIGLAAALPLTLVLGIAVGAAGSESASNAAVCSSEVGSENLDADQTLNAQTIIQVATEMKLPSRAAVIAVATAMQESSLINRTGGDRDSLGLFQQRPSQGWGTPAQLTTPAYATRVFYRRLITIPGWQTLPLTQAAQAVQRSANTGAYAQWEPLATALVADFTRQPACASGIPPAGSQGAAIVTWASKWLGTRYQFGGGTYTGPTVGLNSDGSGKPGFDCSGLTMYAVYHATGGRVKLDHLVASQFRDPHVRLIGYHQLQPGDLVFWAGSQGTRENPAHIGIYIGSQRFINAPQTGSVVRIDSMAPGTHRYRTLIAGGRITT